MHPKKHKIDAILQAPSPTNLKQLQSFIGLCNFYSRSVNNFANKMSPFYALLQKITPFRLTEQHEKSFEEIKSIFASKIMLHHFNPTFDTCLETDSSSYGVGAVLMHRENENHDWLPVQYSSRSLNSAEKNYSQVEREALSVIFGVDRFRNYLLGSKFVIKNDHKPLFTLFAKH